MGFDCKWANDSQNFILDYFDIIHSSPSHIYHSALPLSPSSSWLKECFNSEVSKGVKIVTGIPDRWETYYHTVPFNHLPVALACWEDITIIGLETGSIIILDTVTGTHTSTLSGHTDWVRSLAISSNGVLLVSGSDDKTIKLWDIQAGVLSRTFPGHSCSISSVSISADNTKIASGSWDHTVQLWNVQTGEYQTIKQCEFPVTSVNFSPTDPQRFISASQNGIIQQWDTNCHEIGPTHSGTHAIFSPNGTQFISYGGRAVKVHNSDSGDIIAESYTDNNHLWCCCFSPDGRFVAGAAGCTIYLWNITGSEFQLVKAYIGHTSFITSLAFSSYLISASDDKTTKFWKTSALPPSQVATGSKSIALSSVPIRSISLQAKDSIAISSDSAGVVRIWNLETGLPEEPFQTQATGKRDVQLIDGRLIIVWYDWKIGVPGKVHAWDVKEGKLLWVSGQSWSRALDLKISGSGDESKVFLLDHKSIQAWSVLTGRHVGEVEFKGQYPQGLTVNDLRVWLSYSDPTGSSPMGWDFGTTDQTPPPLSNTPPYWPRLDFINGTTQKHAGSFWIEDRDTERVIFYLPERFVILSAVSQWDGQYLVVGYPSGEVLILDFNHRFLHSR